MNKVGSDPRLPIVTQSLEYLRNLNARLYEIFRNVTNVVNAMADGYLFETTTATGDYTATAADQLILVDNTANCTVTLPAADTTKNKRFVVKKVSNNGYTVTVTAASGFIDDDTNAIIADAYTSLDFVSDGSNYWII